MSQPGREYSKDVFAFIEGLDEWKTADDVLVATEKLVAPFGLDLILFAGLRLQKKQKFNEVVLTTRWPPEFLKLYVEREFLRDDPIARLGRQSANPFS